MTRHDAAPVLDEVAGIEALAQPLPAGLRIWRVHLDRYELGDVGSSLAPDERARAARFLRKEDGRRFQAARHALRRILGSCTGRDPATLAFALGEFGKPRLADDDALEFNLSHSADACLVAVSRSQAVGVDVERVSIVRDIDALARRHYTVREQEQLRAAGRDGRRQAFLAGWTRKEACMKSLGVGLSLPPASIDAGCDEAPREVDVEVAGTPCRIAVVSLALGDGALGAVALVSREAAASARRRLA